MSNTKSSNQAAVPEAKGALDRFKFEVANELGVPLTDGYNGNLTSKQNSIRTTAEFQFYILYHSQSHCQLQNNIPRYLLLFTHHYPETYNPRNNCIIAFILGRSYDKILRHFRNRNLVFAVPE